VARTVAAAQPQADRPSAREPQHIPMARALPCFLPGNRRWPVPDFRPWWRRFLYRSARGGVGGNAIDVRKLVTRYEPVERHSARHEKIDEARDEVSRSTVALDHSAHNPAALQPWHLEADLRAGAGAAGMEGILGPNPGAKISICHGGGGMFAASRMIVMSKERRRERCCRCLARLTDWLSAPLYTRL
jgi:hypothetical protein